ncbi:CrcB family protein [Nocardioides humilatus]|uniref:Fluoride-specific ion channel FluC n=1 Tax=Nocardioides humilatus TaxID=2607660 RepID=A0A5B1LN34_9ACTN|nr:CrcB family protein [Nocardioides humilatus]KAA1421518.1 CrcB family protein [Nocardioides humilatus]
MTALLVALGAAVGAPTRYALGQLFDGRFHTGTLVANTAASLALGLCVGWGAGASTYALVGTGFCGGMSTYSSFAVQARDQGPRLGTAYVGATLALGLLAATGGYLLAQA